jgi:hypothetical protein
MKTTIGGERLGSGSKAEISDKNYERSTHDLGYIWRSSMSAGTLIPFMSEVGLPGDSFDVDLDCSVLTLPTIGPLFGSYKVQLDVFQCPLRLYNGKLHMNMLNIGMDMSAVKLPQLMFESYYNINKDDNMQVNPSSILSYFGIRGAGRKTSTGTTAGTVKRSFNAIPLLAYWEIYKNYYANKQEERGFYIDGVGTTISSVTFIDSSGEYNLFGSSNARIPVIDESEYPTEIIIDGSREFDEDLNFDEVFIYDNDAGQDEPITSFFEEVFVDKFGRIVGRFWKRASTPEIYVRSATLTINPNSVSLKEFPLTNIDDMRMSILADVASTSAFQVDKNSDAPYGAPLALLSGVKWKATLSQMGLGVKTYQSDLFNNWISTEWIDGTNGINEITSIDTSGGSFNIDTLNLASKVYEMLNRIAISGGSFDNWLDAVYTHERAKSIESPVYHGSLIKELTFEEVISNAETETEFGKKPLGTLAGKGRLTQKDKGGKFVIKVHEPSYIIGIVSLTPRLDYSQGNKWDMNLKTMDDFHKPALDQIGYQDLITDQMAWFDTVCDDSDNVEFFSAGKQPAWLNYMTNVNRCYGNFADINKEMFMTLNRRYEFSNSEGISDLTTYIDPIKFNQIFADTALDAQNFWTQIKVDLIARRKMSAKQIPNL